jgi:acetyltransferase-like isoleucine patch superfamily enzyme
MNFKKSIESFLKKTALFRYVRAIRIILRRYAINTKKLGYFGVHSVIAPPFMVANPKNVFINDNVRIHANAKIYNYTGKFIIKKNSDASINCVVVTGNHTPTVGIPQHLLVKSHVNDRETDVVVEENVWIGGNVTLLSGATIGRGAVIGACSLVNKKIPPYAVAVGIPTKIIASTFTLEQIIEHEKILYAPEERFSRVYLEQLFAEHFQGKKTIGTSYISEEDKKRAEDIGNKWGIKIS